MTNFASLHQAAHIAGKAAADALIPRAMIVSGGVPGERPKSYYEAEGVCGFAWIQFKGTTPWARWAKANLKTGRGHPTGLTIWVSDYGQSMQRKEAYARAYASVLNNGGVSDAYADSRMD